MSILRVLIADDKAMMRDFLKHTLNSIDSISSVVAYDAANGEEAISLFKKHKIDIVFLDINMQPMDGIETLKEIRKLNNNIFIVMVSSESSIENVKASIASGSSGFIVKPYNGQKVSDILDNFIQLNPEWSD